MHNTDSRSFPTGGARCDQYPTRRWRSGSESKRSSNERTASAGSSTHCNLENAAAYWLSNWLRTLRAM